MNIIKQFFSIIVFIIPSLAFYPKVSLAVEYKIFGKAVCKIEQNGTLLSFKSIDISNYGNEQSTILNSDRGDIEFLVKHTPDKDGEPGLSFTSLKIDDFQYKLFLPVKNLSTMGQKQKGERTFLFNSGFKDYKITCHFWRLLNGEN